MDTLLGVVNVFIAFYLMKMLFNLFIQAKRATKHKEELQKINLEKMQAEEEKEEVIETVKDEICGTIIPKTKAYIVDRNNQKHYFCSWKCREEFRGQGDGN